MRLLLPALPVPSTHILQASWSVLGALREQTCVGIWFATVIPTGAGPRGQALLPELQRCWDPAPKPPITLGPTPTCPRPTGPPGQETLSQWEPRWLLAQSCGPGPAPSECAGRAQEGHPALTFSTRGGQSAAGWRPQGALMWWCSQGPLLGRGSIAEGHTGPLPIFAKELRHVDSWEQGAGSQSRPPWSPGWSEVASGPHGL